MKVSNAQFATEMLAAYQRGDSEALARMVGPEIEVYSDAGNVGTYRGMDGLMQWTSAWEEAWEDSNYEIVQLSEISGEVVVGAVRVKATGRNSGVPIKAVYGYLWEIQKGKATRFHVYETHELALERAEALAAGE